MSRIFFELRDGDESLPLLAIMHQSPVSSWSQAPLLDTLRYRGPVAVFDTPGFGKSSPLKDAGEGEGEIPEYAEALWEAIEELAGPAGVYLMGQHTGAILALPQAVTHPEHVKGVVFQALPIYPPEEREARLSGYVPEFAIQQDGSHLVAIWERIKGLYPDVAPEIWMRNVADYVTADPDYAAAYRAVFRYDSYPSLERFKASGIPAITICGDGDLVVPRLNRVEEALGIDTVLIPGCSDFSSYEDPVAVGAAIDAWLDSLSAGNA